MHLVSFDIGIKNMAFCVMHDNARILQWTVLNLMAPEPPPPRCALCTRKARFCKQDTHYCSAHANKLVKAGTLIWIDPLPKTLVELRAVLASYQLDVAGSKAECLARFQAWAQEHVLDPVRTVKPRLAPDADLIDIGRRLTDALDAAGLPIQLDHVLIENQLSPLASRMRTLQGMLTQYFIMRRPSAVIHYISATNKLKAFVTSSPSTSTAAQKYKQRKVDSVAFCEKFLAANNTGGTLAQSKKDDLADCFLQALWFLKHEGQINWGAEDLKIKTVET